MSLRLNGSTSGYVEIDAPAVAGTTNVTLPATSGEAIIKATDGSVDLGSVEIDASGRVGIGTTSPSHPIHIKNATDAFIRLEGLNSLSVYKSLYMGVSAASAGQADIQYPGALRFYDLEGSSERARIDSSGRLLVGTSSSSDACTFVLQGGSVGSTQPGIARLHRNATITTSTAIGGIIFGKNGINGAHIYGVGDAAWSDGTSHPTHITFGTTASGASSPTERFRIGANGQCSFSNGSIFISSTALGPGAGTNALKWNSSTGIVTWDSSSRLVKENIEDCPYGIDAIKLLQPRKYFRTDDQRDEIGFVADELVGVLPEFVPVGPKSAITKNEEDTEEIPLGVNYEKLTAVLTKALQEAIAKIETLEAKVAALEANP